VAITITDLPGEEIGTYANRTDYSGWGNAADQDGNAVVLGTGNQVPGRFGGRFTVNYIGLSRAVIATAVGDWFRIASLDGNHSQWPADFSWSDDNNTFDSTVNWTVIPGDGATVFVGTGDDRTAYTDGVDANAVVTMSHYLNGLRRDDNGYLYVTTSGAINHYLHGLPFSAAGSLCVEAGAVDHYSNGWPMTANNKVAIA